MAKMVRYNGGIFSYLDCTNPAVLSVGKVYEVIAEKDRGWQTDYTLKGVKGAFNSCWFNEIKSERNAFMAFAHKAPVEGEKFQCTKVEIINGQPEIYDCSTSAVEDVRYLGNNIYQVYTRNSVYIVKVS